MSKVKLILRYCAELLVVLIACLVVYFFASETLNLLIELDAKGGIQ